MRVRRRALGGLVVAMVAVCLGCAEEPECDVGAEELLEIADRGMGSYEGRIDRAFREPGAISFTIERVPETAAWGGGVLAGESQVECSGTWPVVWFEATVDMVWAPDGKVPWALTSFPLIAEYDKGGSLEMVGEVGNVRVRVTLLREGQGFKLIVFRAEDLSRLVVYSGY